MTTQHKQQEQQCILPVGKGNTCEVLICPLNMFTAKDFDSLRREKIFLIFKSMNLYVLKFSVEKHTHTTLTAFLSTL